MMASAEHEHDWEPTFRLSWITGTPHRRCTVGDCDVVTLDPPADPDGVWVVEYGIWPFSDQWCSIDDRFTDEAEAIRVAERLQANAPDGARYVIEDQDGNRLWPEAA